MHEEGDITTVIEIAELLNNHFGTVFTSENLNHIPEFNIYRKKMEYFRINEVINNCITNLKLSKCSGSDEISSRILKMIVDSTSKALILAKTFDKVPH